MTIEAAHYRETIARLEADPIIKKMAKELLATGETVDSVSNGIENPSWEFMMACQREYKKRGGAISHHLGGPARAVLNLMIRS
jgi:hypothetical protein